LAQGDKKIFANIDFMIHKLKRKTIIGDYKIDQNLEIFDLINLKNIMESEYFGSL
jgi:hypothetical protein